MTCDDRIEGMVFSGKNASECGNGDHAICAAALANLDRFNERDLPPAQDVGDISIGASRDLMSMLTG